MKLFNETPFAIKHAHSELEPEVPFVTVAIKGAFRLVAGGICEPLPAKDQPKIGGSEKFKDRQGNSMKSDNDLVAFKPRADCLLVGSAYAPGGETARILEAVFGVGDMRKRLSVFGDRAWLREHGGSVRLVGPEPFTEMPIRAERAHGGPRSVYNKHGIGFEPLDEKPGSLVRVANIMDTETAALPWDRDAAHAGFGAIPKNLQPRRALAGTFDADWQYRRRPLPPKDFDPGHLNSAPRDQQVEDFLAGDEELYFENLHPDLPRFTSRLPGLKVRCFVNRILNPEVSEELEFAEVITCLDTCFVDMPAGTVTLTWRGTMEIESFEHLQLTHMLICQEPLTAPLDVNYYADLMAQKIEASTITRPQGMSPEERQAKIDGLNSEGMERIVKMLKKGGAPQPIIDKIEKMTTVDEAMPVITEWVEDLKKGLPDLPDLPDMPDMPQ